MLKPAILALIRQVLTVAGTALVAKGYRIRQANRCIVYPQECNTVREEWRRWRRWIAGFAVCLRLHPRLLFSRFGLFSIFPMFGLVVLGVLTYAAAWTNAAIAQGPAGVVHSLLPIIWVGIIMAIGLFSAIYHKRKRLVFLAPFAVSYVLLAYAIWITHGVRGFFTGAEPARDKPTRHSYVVR